MNIVSPYYVAILYLSVLPNLSVLVFHALHKTAKWQVIPSLWQYLSHLLFVHTLSPATWSTVQGAFWSLGLEAQFYLVFPLVVLAYSRYGIKITRWMIAGSIIYRLIASVLTAQSTWTVQFLASVTFMGRWMEFAAGMIAAWYLAKTNRLGGVISGRNGFCTLTVCIGLYILAMTEKVAAVPYLPVRDLLLATCYSGAIFAVCASQSKVRLLFVNRYITGIGFIAYSIFLIHQATAFYLGALLKKVFHLNGSVRFGILESVRFVGIVGLSYLFFRGFEAPFLYTRKPNAVV